MKMKLLDKITGTIISGVVIAVLIAQGTDLSGANAANSLIIWIHVLAGVAWMISMTKFEISYAYPFTLLGLVLVTIFSVIFFGESVNTYKIIGIAMIILGIVLISKGV